MKVAFTLFGDESWTGGLNYLRNLFSALAEVPGRPIEPVLFISQGKSPNTYVSLTPYLKQDPIIIKGWHPGKVAQFIKLARALITQCDTICLTAFRKAGIDLVFDSLWYGARFPLPTLGWIPDFQHCHLKQFFTKLQLAMRWAQYTLFCKSASRIMVSSKDARHDCETFFPSSKGKISVVSFAVQLDDSILVGNPHEILAQYKLPNKFLYLPAQFWKHKNHLVLLEALRLLKQEGQELLVVASGSANNKYAPKYPEMVLAKIKNDKLEDYFRYLGLIPYEHIMPLMRISKAVINPSLFEGWSTTVEEAKALGVPLLLSNLRVHQEQAPHGTLFFNPESPIEIATALSKAWNNFTPGPNLARENAALTEYRLQRQAFGQHFVQVVKETIAVQHKKALTK